MCCILYTVLHCFYQIIASGKVPFFSNYINFYTGLDASWRHLGVYIETNNFVDTYKREKVVTGIYWSITFMGHYCWLILCTLHPATMSFHIICAPTKLVFYPLKTINESGESTGFRPSDDKQLIFNFNSLCF